MKGSSLTLLLSLTLAGVVFVLDFLLPVQVAAGVGYMLVVALSFSTRWPSVPVLLAGFCSGLVIFRPLALSNAAEVLQNREVIADRFLSLFAIWVTAVLTVRLQRFMAQAELLQNEREAVDTNPANNTALAQTADSNDPPQTAVALSGPITAGTEHSPSEATPADRRSARREWDWFAVLEGTSAVAVCLTRPDGRLVRANPAWQEFFGYTAGDVAAGQLHWQSFVSPEQRPNVEQFLLQTTENGRSAVWSETLIGRGGRALAATLQVVELSTARLPVAGHLWFVIDASREHQLAGERDTALQNASAAEQNRTQLLHTISHEIRPQLESILETVEESGAWAYGLPGEPGAMELAANAQELLARLDDVADLSQTGERPVSLRPTEFDLHDDLENQLQALGQQHQATGCAFLLDYDDQLPETMTTDRRRLRQIVQGGVSQLLAERSWSHIVIEASAGKPGSKAGHGRAHGQSVSLQLRFCGRSDDTETANRSAVRNPAGGEFAQTLAGRMVAALSGRITVEQRNETEHLIGVQIPVETARTADSTTATYRLPELVGVPVLIVDHRPAAQRTLERRLRSWNMVPTTTNSVYAALETLRQAKQSGRPFPLVLAHAELPGVSGHALAERLQRDSGLAEELILLVSAQNGRTPSTSELSQRVRYVSQPLRRAELFKAVTAAVGVDTTSNSFIAAHTTTTAAPHTPVFPPSRHLDWTAAYQAAERSTERLRVVIDEFLSESPQHLQTMRAGIAASDANGVQQSAEELARLATPLCCGLLLKTAQRVQQLAGRSDLAETPSLWDTLRRELAALVDELTDFLVLDHADAVMR